MYILYSFFKTNSDSENLIKMKGILSFITVVKKENYTLRIATCNLSVSSGGTPKT